MQSFRSSDPPDESGSKVAAVLGGLAAGYLISGSIQLIGPPWAKLNFFEAKMEFSTTFSSAVVLLWAVFAVPRWQRWSLRWAKRIVAVHSIGYLAAAFWMGGGIVSWIILSLFSGIPDLSFLFFFPRPNARQETLLFARKAVLILVGGQVFGLLLWSWMTIAFAAWSATSLAHGRPYCIGTGQGFTPGKGMEYRPVAAWLDMQGLAMQAPQQHGGSNLWSFTFHAVLVVLEDDLGTSRYNWSYWNFGFVPIKNASAILGRVNRGICHPETGFLDKLPFSRTFP